MSHDLPIDQRPAPAQEDQPDWAHHYLANLLPLLDRVLMRAEVPKGLYYWSARTRSGGGFSLSQVALTPEQSRDPKRLVHPSVRRTETWPTVAQAIAAYLAYGDGYDMAVLHRHGTGTPPQLCPYKLGSPGERLWLRGYTACKEK